MKQYLAGLLLFSAAWAVAQDATAPATQPETAPATTQPATEPQPEPLELQVTRLQAEVERLKRENQALQQTVDGMRTNAGPAWVSLEKFNALQLELENEKTQTAVLRAEIEELRKHGPATQPATQSDK